MLIYTSMKYPVNTIPHGQYQIAIPLSLFSILSQMTIKNLMATDAYLWLIYKQIQSIESSTSHSYMPFMTQYSELSNIWQCPYMSARFFLQSLQYNKAVIIQRCGHRISILVLHITCSTYDLLFPNTICHNE
jgi:hypothetical protein